MTHHITIHLNGKPVEALQGQTIAQLLEHQGVDPAHVVVEINRNIIDRDAYDSTAIGRDDEIEVLRFVGGG